MTPTVQETLLLVSNSLALSILVKATFTLALVLCAATVARQSPAAVRHAILAAGFGALLLLPIASPLAPRYRIRLPAVKAANRTPARTTAAIPHAPAPGVAGVSTSTPRAPQLASALLAVWITGVAGFLLPVVAGLWQVRKLRRSALPWREGQSITGELALDAGVRRPVEVLVHESLAGPMACGGTRPAIVLPLDAQTWEADELQRALVHELEHIRRRDWLGHSLARVACAAYWFHPLAWIAWRQLALEAERACDDAVLRRAEPTTYADQLVALARRLSAARRPALLAMASRADLAARVGAVLDDSRLRGRAGRLVVVSVWTSAAIVVAVCSPLAVVAAPQFAAAKPTAEPVDLFSVTEGLVIADASVRDASGRSVEGLTPDDFAITEDGVPQQLSVFESVQLPQQTGGVTSYYILGYNATNSDPDGRYRNIGIALTRPMTAKLDYRKGYFAGRAFANAAASQDKPKEVTPVVAPNPAHPVLLYRTQPEYSDEARKAKHQGTVVLSIVVGAAGQATDIQVMRSLGLGLDEKAVDAVKQWAFQPGVKNGRFVSMPARVEINFRLY